MKITLHKVTLLLLSEKPEKKMGDEWRKDEERDEISPDGFTPNPSTDPKKKPSR